MEEINNILERYGLIAKNNPSNKELKRMIRYLIKDSGIELKNPGQLKARSGKRVVIMDGKSIDSQIMLTLSGLVGDVYVNDAERFIEQFSVDGQKRIAEYQLEKLRTGFNMNVFGNFLLFRSKDDTFIEMVMMEVLEDETHPAHRRYIEQKMKQMFAPEKNEGLTEMGKMRKWLRSELDELVKMLERNPRRLEMIDEVRSFLFKLVSEIVEEEYKLNQTDKTREER